MSPRLRKLRLVLPLVLVTAAAAPVAAQVEPVGGRLPVCPELVPPPDPAVDLEHGCYFFGNYTWNDGSGAGNVAGRVYWPSDCSSSTPPGVHPLVLLMHGDGHSYLDYGYLASHLARNGFVVASIANSGTNQDRAADALTYLGFVRDHWTHEEHVANSIALVGHSRGGEAVLTTARRIVELGLSHDVDALVSIAPTDNDEGGPGVHESLDGGEGESYLVIYGSHDEDVLGPCVAGTAPGCGAAPAGPRRTGFGLFDRAGVEGETEPFPLVDEVVTRAMVFVEGANHNGFRDTCGGLPLFGQISCDAHQDVARGYLNAFLRWRLRGQSLYRDFLTGSWTPESVALAGTRVHTQYVEGYGRRVVDDFQNAALGTNALGGTLVAGGVLQVLHHGPLWQYVDTTPHDTRGLVVAWNPPGLAPSIRWSIPNTLTAQGARHRDVRGFATLSLRAGQVDGSAFNADGTAKDFLVRLTDSTGHVSNSLRASLVTEIADPPTADLTTSLGQSATTISSSMQTVRLPLCRFQGVDLANVAEVSIFFTAPGSGSGELMLDNLEFAD